MLPICTSCKKIKNDEGYWNKIEVYIKEHSGAEFSHGLVAQSAKKDMLCVYGRISSLLGS
jgi:hypothetical protein